MSRIVPPSSLALLLVWFLLHAAPGLAACPEPTARAAVALPVAEALQGFAAMDDEGFAAARDRAVAALPCLAEPLTGPEAAAYHGLMALDAFLRQDDAGAVNSFRAALASEPAWALPPETVPEAHPINVQLQVARSLTGSPTAPLPDLAPDSITVDGAAAAAAPTDRPAILQRISADGTVVDTAYLSAGGALPAWAPAVPFVAEPLPPERRRPIALAAGAGASLLASGACLGLAWRAHEGFVSPNTESGYPDEPTTLRAQANGLTWASIGTGALALGLGTVTVVRW